MQTDLAILRERIFEAAKTSPIGEQVQAVVVESDRDDEGADFLRVVIEVEHSDRVTDPDFETLLEAIEGTVSALDERYPSVRFSDAA